VSPLEILRSICLTFARWRQCNLMSALGIIRNAADRADSRLKAIY